MPKHLNRLNWTRILSDNDLPKTSGNYFVLMQGDPSPNWIGISSFDAHEDTCPWGEVVSDDVLAYAPADHLPWDFANELCIVLGEVAELLDITGTCK